MVEKFLEQTTFTSQEDFIKNLKIKIPENLQNPPEYPVLH